MSALPRRAITDPDPPHDEGIIRVLLVDDHSLVADALRTIFEPHADVEFFYCSDPSSALKVAQRIRPTVILQDLIMPEVSGVDLVREFRTVPDLMIIPIVMLSSKEDPQSKEEAFSAGANDYLVKLPDEIEIVARVRYHSGAYVAHLRLQETVDELKKVNSQLFQSERMASIGLLAAGVAHEINNPVAFITSNLNSLKDYYDDVFRMIDVYQELEDSLCDKGNDLESIRAIKKQLKLTDVREDIEQILDECKDGLSRVRKIVEDMRGFSRSDDATMQPTDLHEELDRTLNIASNEIKYKADVKKTYGNLPKVECIPSQVCQVFLNLLVNAAQAIDGRGSIGIETVTQTLPENLASQVDDRDVDADADPWVCVRISDTGNGIDPESVRHIFDPFYTTKEVGKGTGLGLSLSYGIVQRHGGFLEVESEPGEGTTFSVWLPGRQPDERASQ